MPRSLRPGELFVPGSKSEKIWAMLQANEPLWKIMRDTNSSPWLISAVKQRALNPNRRINEANAQNKRDEIRRVK